jgi:hypothetical protein
MDNRSGEKWGWIGGFFGATCWILAVAFILLTQGEILQGLIGLVLYVAAVTVSVRCAPWRNPNTRYWKLMLGSLATPLGSMVGGIWCFGDQTSDLLFLLPVVTVLIPVWQQRHRRWSDSGTSDKPLSIGDRNET